MRLIFVVIFLIYAMPVNAFDYRGDGTFSDSGATAGFDRYRLVLPPINLCRAGVYYFIVGELPAESFFLEIEYAYSNKLAREEAYQLKDAISSEINIELSLEDLEKKSAIYNYAGKFYESGHDELGKPFSRGFPGVVEHQYGKIVFRVEQVDFHKGFFWQHHSSKRLDFAVTRPLASLINCTANFVFSGGGWK